MNFVRSSVFTCVPFVSVFLYRNSNSNFLLTQKGVSGIKKKQTKTYQTKPKKEGGDNRLEARRRHGHILEATSQKYGACYVTDVWS